LQNFNTTDNFNGIFPKQLNSLVMVHQLDLSYLKDDMVKAKESCLEMRPPKSVTRSKEMKCMTTRAESIKDIYESTTKRNMININTTNLHEYVPKIDPKLSMFNSANLNENQKQEHPRTLFNQSVKTMGIARKEKPESSRLNAKTQ
jgi:hypothetical protein